MMLAHNLQQTFPGLCRIPINWPILSVGRSGQMVRDTISTRCAAAFLLYLDKVYRPCIPVWLAFTHKAINTHRLVFFTPPLFPDPPFPLHASSVSARQLLSLCVEWAHRPSGSLIKTVGRHSAVSDLGNWRACDTISMRFGVITKDV